MRTTFMLSNSCCAARCCAALPDAWKNVSTGKLLPFATIEALVAASGDDLQRYRCCVDFAGPNALDWSDSLLYRYGSPGGMLDATETLLLRPEFTNLLCLVLLVRGA